MSTSTSSTYNGYHCDFISNYRKDSSKKKNHVFHQAEPSVPNNVDREILPELKGLNDQFAHEPKFDGTEPWKAVRERVDAYDKKLYEGWTDDINNLNVVAALLTAIVTAFAIESYQWLQPDPADVTNILLLHISQQLSNRSLPAAPDPSSIPFSPSASAVRINIVWFMSITLSLSCALIGVVCQQWIRELGNDNGISSLNNLRLRVHQTSDARRWKLPTIVAILPVLLELSVMLFFIGTLDLLRDLSIPVVIPNSVVAGLSISLMVFTTVLPALLLITGHDSHQPSPFKSAQSWLVAQIASHIFNIQTSTSFTEGLNSLLDVSRLKRSDTDKLFIKQVLEILHDSLPTMVALYHAINGANKNRSRNEIVLSGIDKRDKTYQRSELGWIVKIFHPHASENNEITKFIHEILSRDAELFYTLDNLGSTRNKESGLQLVTQIQDEELMLQLMAQIKAVCLERPQRSDSDMRGALLCHVFSLIDNPSQKVRDATSYFVDDKTLWIGGITNREDQLTVLRRINEIMERLDFQSVVTEPKKIFYGNLVRSLELCRQLALLEVNDISKDYEKRLKFAAEKLGIPGKRLKLNTAEPGGNFEIGAYRPTKDERVQRFAWRNKKTPTLPAQLV